MASLELRKQTYRVVFMHGGRKYGYSLDTGDRQTAEALRGGVEKTLMRIEQSLLPVPEGADIVAFVRSDGQAPHKAAPPRARYLRRAAGNLPSRACPGRHGGELAGDGQHAPAALRRQPR